MRSQQEVLTALATRFKQYLEYDPDAKLSVGGYTDERGADKYNDSLSELRVQRVKDFLVSQGIAAEKIEISAYGKQKPLDKATISDLQNRNPNKPPEKRVRDVRAKSPLDYSVFSASGAAALLAVCAFERDNSRTGG